MKSKGVKKLLCTAMATMLTAGALAGCGSTATLDNKVAAGSTAAAGSTEKEKTDTTDVADVPEGTGEEEVTITLGIWPEDTLTEDITMHEGFVETMKTLHPNVNVVPAYYKYATDTFMPLVESGNCPTIFETWFTEPQKLINAGAVADITDELEERGWLDKMNPAVRELLSDENGRIYGVPRDGYALGLMMNVELFEQAGLVDENGYPIYPKTWDELAETAKTIKDATGSAGL